MRMADASRQTTPVVGDHLSGDRQLMLPPQPLGLFALPLGYLLIPAGAETDAARRAMLAGCLPETWPPIMRSHQLAAAGERDAAIAALDGQGDPVARYNRFVLDPDGIDPVELR